MQHNHNHHHLFRLEMLLLIIFSICLSTHAQEYSELTFRDTFKYGTPSSYNIPALKKMQRVNRSASSISAIGNDMKDEEMMKVFEYVLSVWKAHILNAPDIYIQIEKDDIVSDIETTVGYIAINKIAYPTALIGYLEGRPKGEPTIPDGKIVINRNVDWDYALGDNIDPNKKNLAFGLMRAIARILGFGSDVAIDANDNYYFLEKRNHPIFNKIVENSIGRRLFDIPKNGGRQSAELKAFVEEQNQTFNIVTSQNKYQLASPPYSTDYPPFVYLANPQSLMRKDISSGDHYLQIDDTTQAILQYLGWNTQAPAVEIISEDLPDTGLASAYESHGFKLKHKRESTITEEKWRLELPLGNGQYEYVGMRQVGNYWYTDPITSAEKYNRNLDGDIEAKVCCTCALNGNIVEVFPFNVRFELQPEIEYAVIERIEDEYPSPSYNAYYKVKYNGAEQVQVYVEEEYRAEVKLSYINEPYVAYGCATHVTSPFRAWIDFVVVNNYGKSTYTISLLPNGEIDPQGMQKIKKSENDLTQTDMTMVKSHSEYLYVYDACGNKVAEISTLDELTNIQYKGLVVVRQSGSDGEVKHFKTILK